MSKPRWIGGILAALAGLTLAAENPFTVSAALAPDAEGRRLTVTFGVPDGHYLYDDMLTVTAAPPASLLPIAIPRAELHHDAVTGTDRAVHTQSFARIYGVAGPETVPLTVTVGWQGCKGELCYLPAEKTFMLSPDGGLRPPAGVAPVRPASTAGLPAGFRIRSQAEGYMTSPAFLAFLEGTPEAGAARGTRWQQWIAGGGLLGILIILLGGLALNLTPCVLPMIPVNLAIIGAGAKAGSRGRGLVLGLLYGLGMAAAYGALGMVVVLTGAVFGTLNASPWFNLIFAVLFILLALATFGVFTFDLSRFQPSTVPGGGRKTGAMAFGLAFLLGALSALLAGACVAPVVVAVLAHASELYAAGERGGLFLPLVLGLGMALPWPFAGAGMAVLPKPGRWMEGVKYGMGAIIVLLALNYGWNAWNGFRWSRETMDSRAALARGLEDSAKTGKPVFIDFWASWCKSCRTMDDTTFRDEAVRKALAGFVVVKFQAERPGEPAIKAVLDSYGVKGLPTYVVLEQER